MKKGNFYRLIFWGVIFLILIVASAFGIAAYHNGYGKVGSIVYKIKPIADTFNDLKSLERYSNAGIELKAKAKDNKIIVEYTTMDVSSSYEFIYENVSNLDTLKISYNNANEQTAKIITEFIIDSVSIINGYEEGEVFTTYTLDDFTYISLNEGILVTDQGNLRTVVINMNESVLNAKEEINLALEKKSFIEQINKIYAVADQKYLENHIPSKYYQNGDILCKIDGKEISELDSSITDYNYFINVNNKGKITEIHLINQKFAFSDKNDEGLNITNELDIIDKNINEESYIETENELINVCDKETTD